MITAKNLHVTFGRGTPLEKHALRGVDLAIPSGQFVTVIGSNGAGKSTVLGALAGDVIPDRGTVGDRARRSRLGGPGGLVGGVGGVRRRTAPSCAAHSWSR